MEKINKEIELLLEAKSQNESIKDRLVYLEAKLQKLNLKEQAYLRRSEDELADVKRLEQLGLRSLFKKVLGNLEAHVEKEKEEYLLAVLAHKSIEEEIEVIKFEINVLKKKYRNPESIAEELSTVVKKKEFLLKSYDTNFTKELFKRESEIGRIKLMLHKGKKSDEMADAAIMILNNVITELKEVKDWPPSGARAMASYRKKKYIDRARAKCIQTKVRLEEFAEFSSRLFEDIDMDYDLTPFEDFLDTFYNNLITDYIVRDRLKKTLDSMEGTLLGLTNAKMIINKEVLKYKDLVIVKERDLESYTLSYNKKTGV